MSVKTGIAVLFFFALVGVIQYPNVVEFVQDMSATDQTVAVPNPVIAAPGNPGSPGSNLDPSPTRSVSKSDLTVEDLKLLALEYINEDRRLYNLEPVVMGSNPAAQMHADEMEEARYLGHWWLDGSKPYMVYSETGGMSYVSENAARTGFSEAQFNEMCTAPNVVCDKVDPSEDIKRLQHAMVYDDASSDWGHRDNILNPTHRKVNIGIAYNDRFLALVQHFEGGDVTAPVRPQLEGTVLRIRADINDASVNIFPTVEVHYETTPVSRTVEEIERLNSYCVGGGFSAGCGAPVVRIVPPPHPGTQYVNLPDDMVVASTWVVSGGDIEIVADLGPRATEPGVYTTSLYEDAGDGNGQGGLLLQLSTVK